MRIRDRNWMQIEQYLAHDDRAVLPLGCTEQHAYLSLSVDSILSEQVALDAAEPLGIPVFPVASHASWMENFPITRLSGIAQPTHQRALVDYANMTSMTPQQTRVVVGDGNFGGYYQKPDEVMATLWRVAVAETRELMQGPWREHQIPPKNAAEVR